MAANKTDGVSSSVSDLLERASMLTRDERLKLAKGLIDQLGDSAVDLREDEDKSEGHWGRELVELLDEIGPIEMVDPHIEDPVEWVKTQRAKRRAKLEAIVDERMRGSGQAE
jgi:hypothetical protein